jgi:hypothetical protein
LTTAIEAGPLEQQVCLLAESVRLFGGRLSGLPFVAVVPRFGPLLRASTKVALRRLGVDIVTATRDDGMSWFPFLNKTQTTRLISRQFKGTIVWFDADVLLLNEPADLLIDDTDVKFAACCTDKNIGTASDDDEFAPYFKACCEVFGIKYESLPYIVTKTEGIPIRAYWNAGIFSFDCDSGLAETYDDFTKLLLRKGIGSRYCKMLMTDQISLGLAAHKLGLRYRELPLSHNFHIQPNDVTSVLDSEEDIRLLHYHGCSWPGSFEKMLAGVSRRSRDAANLLARSGPLSNGLPLTSHALQKSLKLFRGYRDSRAFGQMTAF